MSKTCLFYMIFPIFLNETEITTKFTIMGFRMIDYHEMCNKLLWTVQQIIFKQFTTKCEVMYKKLS